MSQTPSINFSYSPVVQSLIPLLYVAWADRVLSPSQVASLKETARGLPFLSETDKAQLAKWSDPSRPPSFSRPSRLRG